MWWGGRGPGFGRRPRYLGLAVAVAHRAPPEYRGPGRPRRGPRPGAGRNLEAIARWGCREGSPPGLRLIPRTPHFVRKRVLLSRAHRLPNRKGARKGLKDGARRECRAGADVEETPGHCGTPGWRARVVAAIAPDPIGYYKLELVRKVRRVRQHSAIHTVGRKANGDVIFPPSPLGHGESGPRGNCARMQVRPTIRMRGRGSSSSTDAALEGRGDEIGLAHRRKSALRKAP